MGRRSSRFLCLRNNLGYEDFQRGYAVFRPVFGRMCLDVPSWTVLTTLSESKKDHNPSVQFIISQ